MARRCSCAGSCSCLIVSGDGISISGTGSVNSPYVITSTGTDIGESIEFINSDTMTWNISGSGSPSDPYIVIGEAIPVDPGAVNVGAGLAGNGTGLNPLRPDVSGMWGVAPLNVYGSDSTIGREVYVDSAGKLRVRPIASGDVPNLPASKITSGSFDTARIPNLDASKIASGTLATARIPNLDASKITTGQIPAARIGGLPASQITSGVLADARMNATNTKDGNTVVKRSGSGAIVATAISVGLNLPLPATSSLTGNGLSLSSGSIGGMTQYELTEISSTYSGLGTFEIDMPSHVAIHAGSYEFLFSATSGRLQAQGIYDTTTGSAANVNISTTGYLQRSTSSRRYKRDIREARRLDGLLEVKPRTWLSKNEEDRSNNPDGKGRYFGAIAEELHDLGLSELVTYNEKGKPEAIAYDRVAIALIPYIKELRDEVDALKKAVKG